MVSSSNTLHGLGPVGSFPNGKVTGIHIESHQVSRAMIVVRLGDDFYAADNACPHLAKPLAGARLMGTDLICPFHGASFDLSDAGSVRCGPAIRPLKTYPVQRVGDELFVELPKVVSGPLSWMP